MYCTTHDRDRTSPAHPNRASVSATTATLVDGANGLLEPGEHIVGRVQLQGWRFAPTEVMYEQRTVFFGGLLGLAIGIASALDNRRVRRAAERAVAAQWRPLGSLEVAPTNERLLVRHGGAWWSVWYSAIVSVRHDPSNETLELLFEADPPYLLEGDVAELFHTIGPVLSSE